MPDFEYLLLSLLPDFEYLLLSLLPDFEYLLGLPAISGLGFQRRRQASDEAKEKEEDFPKAAQARSSLPPFLFLKGNKTKKREEEIERERVEREIR